MPAHPSIVWTHPSVKRLLSETHQPDPTVAIAERARQLTMDAAEKGWQGPPFDPFELAELRGIALVARDMVDDARLVPGDPPRIEFNPKRTAARIRFSIAHELGHHLFSDADKAVRHRKQTEGDNWQLEMLCNIAAAEFLMPAGAFPERYVDDLSLPHLLDLRKSFGVSTEAVLRRAVRLSEQPAAVFAATREEKGIRIDYLVRSRAWSPRIRPGARITDETMLRRCTAVGFTVAGDETWSDESVRFQAVGVPAYPGHQYPRIVGLVQPTEAVEQVRGRFAYLRGDATEPVGDGPKVVVHVVNDKARRWFRRGFAGALARRWSDAASDYERWTEHDSPQLGTIHAYRVSEDLTIVSMVAQRGYGESKRPRVQLSALDACLQAVASAALDEDASVHMPLIGSGQGRIAWSTVRELVVERICGADVPATAYVLPEMTMPEEIEKKLDSQLSLV